MKKKIYVAILLFSIAALKTIDWLLFWDKNEDLAFRDYDSYIKKYSEQYHHLIRPFFETRPEIASIIAAIFYLIAAYLFWNKDKLFFIILTIFSGFMGIYSLLTALVIKY